MKIRAYLEENVLDVDKEEEKANELVRRKNNLRARIKKAESGDGTAGEIQALRRELRSLQLRHNKLKTQ